MKPQWLLTILTLANLALLIYTVAAMGPAAAQDVAPVLRGRALEIVDGQGRVRASVSVLPAGRSDAGDRYPETVLLRLITERGRPALKMSVSEESSGLMLAGPTGTKETYVQLGAHGTASSLRLKNEDGREQVLKP